jgi:hypothetical protein
MTTIRYDRVLAASKGGSDASSSSTLASDAISVDSSTIEQWAKDKSGDWLVMVYLDHDWNCVDYAPAWEAVVDGLQGMIGLGRINMRTSKGLGASLALSGDEGLLLPTLVMFRDGVFMQSRHIASVYARDSMKSLIAKTYDFVHRCFPPLAPAIFPLPLSFFPYLLLSLVQLSPRIHSPPPSCAHHERRRTGLGCRSASKPCPRYFPPRSRPQSSCCNVAAADVADATVDCGAHDRRQGTIW